MVNELKGKRILLFTGPDFEDSEQLYPYYRFQEAGATVLVAGLGASSYTGKKGTIIETDGRYEDFEDQHFDALIIPGGWAPDKIRMNEAALNLVRKANERNLIIAAICHAGWVLASADVVRNKRLTSYVAIKDDLINAGANWVDEETVIDGNLITARKPTDLPTFSRSIVEALQKTPVTSN